MVALIAALRRVPIRVRCEALPLVEVAVHLGDVWGLIVLVVLGISTSGAIMPRVVKFGILRRQISDQIWHRPEGLAEAVIAVAGAAAASAAHDGQNFLYVRQFGNVKQSRRTLCDFGR